VVITEVEVDTLMGDLVGQVATATLVWADLVMMEDLEVVILNSMVKSNLV
jgi:hypothetical protein